MSYDFKDSKYSSHLKIIELAGSPESSSNSIDIGCASGYLSRSLCRLGWTVIGIDINIPASQQITNSSQVKFLQTDLMTMDLSEFESSFDLVIAGDVIEHVVETEQFLARICHIMKPDSRVIISVPNLVNIFTRLQILFGQFNYQEKGPLDKTHLRFFTLKSLRRNLDSAGLSIQAAAHTGLPLYHFINPRLKLLSDFLMRILESLARLRPSLFAYQFIYVCTKKKNVAPKSLKCL